MSGLLRRLFEFVLRRCIDAGLVGCAGFAVDADANRTGGGAGSEGLDAGKTSRAIREYFETLDDAVFGGASSTTPRFMSPLDPAGRLFYDKESTEIYSYSINYAVHVANVVIVDVEGSNAIRQAEVTAAKRVVERIEERSE